MCPHSGSYAADAAVPESVTALQMGGNSRQERRPALPRDFPCWIRERERREREGSGKKSSQLISGCISRSPCVADSDF